MNKIEEFTSILGKLDELNNAKFNSLEFQKINNKLQELLVEISNNKEQLQSDNFFLDNKNVFLGIKLFFVFQDTKLKVSETVWKRISWKISTQSDKR